MLEFDVVETIADYLVSLGFKIEQALTTTQRGIDIIAIRSAPEMLAVYIEAKGETSSQKGSARYGRPFDSAQSKIHIAEAFYTATELLLDDELSSPRKVGIALPDNELHRRYESRIHDAVLGLGIGVFWVTRDRTVLLEAPWDLE